MYRSFDYIKNITAEKNKEFRESLKEELMELGKAMNDEHFFEWAKSLDDKGIEACLHLVFDEKALLEFLGGRLSVETCQRVEFEKEPTH